MLAQGIGHITQQFLVRWHGYICGSKWKGPTTTVLTQDQQANVSTAKPSVSVKQDSYIHIAYRE